MTDSKKREVEQSTYDMTPHNEKFEGIELAPSRLEQVRLLVKEEVHSSWIFVLVLILFVAGKVPLGVLIGCGCVWGLIVLKSRWWTSDNR